MKRLLAALIGSLLLIGWHFPAIGADLPVKAAMAPAPYVTYDPFSGAYIGVNGGYGWNLGSAQAGIVPLGDFSIAPQGFVGGVHAGYGSRVGQFLYLGAEGDIGIATLTGTAGVPGIISMTSKNTWMGSLRARAGFIPVGHALIYGTVGYGFGSGSFTVADLTTGLSASTNPTVSGLVWGGGLEIPFSPNWLGRVEYLQYDFGTMSATLPTTGTIATKDRVDVVRAGLSYKF